jgi:hypothetical protein
MPARCQVYITFSRAPHGHSGPMKSKGISFGAGEADIDSAARRRQQGMALRLARVFAVKPSNAQAARRDTTLRRSGCL